MPEGSNVEIAHQMSHKQERGRGGPQGRWEELIEILEAVLLAFVAIATAWSGFQAAKWDGRQAELYGRSSAIRIEADELLTLGGQQKLLDVSTFNTWIQAMTSGQQDLAALYERRFSPEFKVAFDAWLETDPSSNPDAPPGPTFMPEYVNSQIAQGSAMNDEASRVFDEGTAARGTAEDYVRTTVVLATVLFLLALSPRFKRRGVRIGVIVTAGLLLSYGLIAIVGGPRL